MTIEKLVEEELEANGGELQGTEQIALTINARDKGWLVSILRRLEERGVLKIIRSTGGRGNKTIYKRNRNSPGQPRKL